jgi:Tol biopolymer transport system component
MTAVLAALLLSRNNTMNVHRSYLETFDLRGKGSRTVVQTFDRHIEAPNWTPDGKWLIYNSEGRLHKISAKGGDSTPIDTGFAIRCNNDHGISPDGTSLVISDQTHEDGSSRIYTLPVQGGKPKLITPNAPSFWHGWSPDGKTLAYCAQRNLRFGIFTIPVDGGEETRLTTSDGLDDGPEYSPHGKHIYFNSDRTGRMQIWRIRPDGTDLTQITNDEYGNWFPHISPDGKWMVILSYDKSVIGHPPNQEVQLRLVEIKTGEIRPLVNLFGGQGTINVPSWAPDSNRFAFVSYDRLSAD